MDWNSPLGVMRRAMQIERDGYKFYSEAAERASGKRGKEMFLSLAADEAKHLRLLLIEYKALESGGSTPPRHSQRTWSLTRPTPTCLAKNIPSSHRSFPRLGNHH